MKRSFVGRERDPVGCAELSTEKVDSADAPVAIFLIPSEKSRYAPWGTPKRPFDATMVVDDLLQDRTLRNQTVEFRCSGRITGPVVGGEPT
jgi:hypothetical protein